MSTTHRAFFGDKERDFRLTPKVIVELERLTDAGIGALCKRLFAGEFSHKDICQTIRLGLIGGGASPEDAANLVAVYAEDAPLVGVHSLAVSILMAAYLGVDARATEAPKQTEEKSHVRIY
jgi:hypothetical protein